MPPGSVAIAGANVHMQLYGKDVSVEGSVHVHG